MGGLVDYGLGPIHNAYSVTTLSPGPSFIAATLHVFSSCVEGTVDSYYEILRGPKSSPTLVTISPAGQSTPLVRPSPGESVISSVRTICTFGSAAPLAKSCVCTDHQRYSHF